MMWIFHSVVFMTRTVSQQQFLHLVLLVPEETQHVWEFLETEVVLQAPRRLRFLPPITLTLSAHFLLSVFAAGDLEFPVCKRCPSRGRVEVHTGSCPQTT